MNDTILTLLCTVDIVCSIDKSRYRWLVFMKKKETDKNNRPSFTYIHLRLPLMRQLFKETLLFQVNE